MRLRKREISAEGSGEATTPSRPLLRRMAQVDMFPKPKEDFRRTQTPAGGLVSTAAVVIILLLVLYEGVGYALGRDAYGTQLSVDHNKGKDMLVNIDMDFPKTPCHSLSLDVVDAAATRRFNVTRSIYKMPLGYKGERIFKGELPPFQQEKNRGGPEEEEDERTTTVTSECLSCFLEGDKRRVRAEAKNSCCRSCNDVEEAYRNAKLAPPPKDTIRQCLGELSRVNPGCNIRGTVVMKKVNSAMVLGPRRTNNGYNIQDVLRFSADHRINKFTIGDERVARFSRHTQETPLEGRSFSPNTQSEVKYFLQVVPTSYTVNGKAQEFSTYEYSARWSARTIALGMRGEIPNVIFWFDLTPIQVDYTFARPPLLHVLVQLCGIVGGLFVVLGIVDSVVSWAVNGYGASA